MGYSFKDWVKAIGAFIMLTGVSLGLLWVIVKVALFAWTGHF